MTSTASATDSGLLPSARGAGSWRGDYTGRWVRYTAVVDMNGLPGADLIERGLADLAAGRESDAAWLVLIGAPRLRRLGLPVPATPPEWSQADTDPAPEHRLYARLASTDSDTAHSRYNALIRTLVSFERAGECVS